MAKAPDAFLLLITRMSCTKSPKPATEELAWLHLLSTYTFHLSRGCSRSGFDQKHAVAVNIFVHEGNHFLITGEVKQSTDCHYPLTRSLVCKWYERRKKTLFGIIISAESPKWGLWQSKVWNLTACPKRHQPGEGFESIKSFNDWHHRRYFSFLQTGQKVAALKKRKVFHVVPFSVSCQWLMQRIWPSCPIEAPTLLSGASRYMPATCRPQWRAGKPQYFTGIG